MVFSSLFFGVFCTFPSKCLKGAISCSIRDFKVDKHMVYSSIDRQRAHIVFFYKFRYVFDVTFCIKICLV